MSLDPSYAPQNETSQEVWVEVSNLIGETVLGATAFGILATLYVLCLSILIPQAKQTAHRNWALFHIVYCSLMFGLIGVGTGANARLAQLYWIDNRAYPGGPYAFITQESNISTLIWGWSVYIVASWLQDAYVIYRCLVFWNWNFLITGLPILAFVGSMGTSIALIVEISRKSQGLTGPLSVKFATCWYIFSVSINVLCTFAIVGRLLWKRKTIKTLLGKEHSRIYTGVVSMLIESAVIYSVFGIIFIATYFRQDPVNNLVLPVLGTLEGICPLMIIYRVACGRGWTNKRMREISSSSLPPMKFQPGQGTTKTARSTTFTTNFSTMHPETSIDFELEESAKGRVQVEREVSIHSS